MDEGLRCFVCADHNGVFLPGCSVVFALDKEDARRLLNQTLLDNGLDPLKPAYTLREIPIARGAELIWDGDY